MQQRRGSMNLECEGAKLPDPQHGGAFAVCVVAAGAGLAPFWDARTARVAQANVQGPRHVRAFGVVSNAPCFGDQDESHHKAACCRVTAALCLEVQSMHCCGSTYLPQTFGKVAITLWSALHDSALCRCRRRCRCRSLCNGHASLALATSRAGKLLLACALQDYTSMYAPSRLAQDTSCLTMTYKGVQRLCSFNMVIRCHSVGQARGR